MSEAAINLPGGRVRVYSYNTVVVGSGAAGLNAADCLYRFGQTDIALVTEDMNAGTSRNTGSDKQTYYKLTLSGGSPDSVREMAQTLFDGQCVDGDIALCEAALSTQSFFRLVELGVPFPQNRYGEYVGYKTDHDPRQRATSIGPYTSRKMTECLEQAVRAKDIPIFDHMQVIKILTEGEQFFGLLCLDLTAPGDPDRRFVAFNCKNVIYATGGPAAIYADRSYPESQYGATGIALEAGVMGKNLTEWQYGLASISPRWNVSGTYMQVLPRFISTDPDGSNEREFLQDFFPDEVDLLSKIFLKGYEWPFDVRKVAGGSSIIDLLVHRETSSGRRVFLDFRYNPGKVKSIRFDLLADAAREYLEKAGACFGTPIERLWHMNRPAVEFYRERGVDLFKEPLEIALCAQHNNGGLAINCWWETNVKGFFAVGEVSGSHGVYRPGGRALNSGQVGSLRAARYIAARRTGKPMPLEAFMQRARPHMTRLLQQAEELLGAEEDNIGTLWRQATVRMSYYGAAIRNIDNIERIMEESKSELAGFWQLARISKPERLSLAFRLYDVLLCQYIYLSAMKDYVERGGKSRGSALYTDMSGKKPHSLLPDMFTFQLDDGALGSQVQEVLYRDGACHFSWRPVRPIPEEEGFFENVWRSYRENQNIDD